ncbi:REJ domain-containing protein [Ochromonadaceae sp. CCMP2298]|nr:REJ domain-containing protein [Ochromonadaceae sp. CCMP2298]
MQPTPSKYPTTTSPTENGDTTSPSRYPTAAPSYNLQFLKDPIYLGYKDAKTHYEAISDSYTFSSFYYKGTTPEGGCSDWGSFKKNDLQLPFDDLEFSALTLDVDFYNFQSQTMRNKTAVCANRDAVHGIVSALRAGSAYAVNCARVQWRVVPCASGSIVCVDCKYAVKILYPEFLSLSVVNTTRTSVRLQYDVTTPGTLHCAALLAPPASALDITTAPASTKVLIFARGSPEYVLFTTAAGPPPVANTSNSNYLSISDLSPGASYAVHCITSDFASHAMPLVSTRTLVVQTLCCRQIQLVTAHSRISEYIASRPESVYTLALIKPTISARVSLTVDLISCTTGNTITPQVAGVQVLPSSFSFLENSTTLRGDFVIRSSETGCFALRLVTTSSDVYDVLTHPVVVQSFRAASVAPALSSVRFSDTGASLLFTFDSPTDQAAHYTSFDCSLLAAFPGASKSLCRWTNSSQLSALLPTSGSLPNVGDVATLRPLVRAACLSDTNCANYVYTAQSTVSISPPSGSLLPLPVLGASSVTISYCDDISLDSTTSTGFGGRDWRSVAWTVAGDAVGVSTAPAIQAHLNSNYKDTFSIAYVPNKLLYRAPKLGPTYTITLLLTNFLGHVGVASKVVVVSSLAAPLHPTYEWKIFKGVRFVPGLVSISREKVFFKLPPYSLDASSSYSLSVTATVLNGTTPLSSFTTRGVLTGESGLAAKIKGGQTLTAGTLDTVTLDASISQDLDYPEAPLSYLWSCKTFEPFGGDCGLTPSSLSSLTISPLTLSAQVYTISVTVANAAGRADTTSVLLTIVAGTVPGISMGPALVKYNVRDKVILSADVATPAGPADVTWGSSVASLSDLALTKLTKRITGAAGFAQLALDSASLTPGASYVFTLSAAYASSPTATSQLTLRMNSPPTGGVLTCTPASGTALSTMFLLLTSRWTDDDLPLSYIISYYSLSLSAAIVVKNQDYSAVSRDTLLGQGLAGLNYIQTAHASATDLYGGVGTATAQVRVGAVATLLAVTATTASLKRALQNADSASFNQALSAGLSAVNAVNCDAPTPCAGLHRQVCSATVKTCGACLGGYIGTVGDSNLPCALPQSLRRVGAACSTSTQCLTSSCVGAGAGGEDGTCAGISKTCPNNCGNLGLCLFSSQEGQEISVCNSLDSCRAYCLCNQGRYGKSCQLSQFEYGLIVSMRESMCYGVYKTLSLQDVTADVVQSRALVVGNILQDICDPALGNCTQALVETVVQHPSLSCTGTSSRLVSAAFSNVLKRGAGLSQPLVDSVDEALAALTAGCQANLAAGEALSLATGNMKLLVGVGDRDSGEWTVPQSAMEAFTGRRPASLSLDSSSLSDADSVGLRLIEYTSNPTGQATNSTKLSVETTSYRGSPSGRRLAAGSAALTLVLQNTIPMQYTVLDSSLHTVRCFEERPQPYHLPLLCPSGLEVNLTCPALAKGVHNVLCPGYAVTPLCTTFDGDAFRPDPACTVVAFTADNTTCLCAPTVRRTSRRLQGGSTTQYSSSFVVTHSTLETDYTPAPPIRVLESTQTVLFASLGALSLFLMGLLAFALEDSAANSRKVKQQKTRKLSKKTRLIRSYFDSIFPDELRADTWLRRVCYHLCKHPLLVLGAHEHGGVGGVGTGGGGGAGGDEGRWVRASRWAALGGKIIIFVFVNAIVAAALYSDNGHCESRDVHTCTSDASDASMGGVVGAYFGHSLTLAILAVPLQKALEYGVVLVGCRLRRKTRGVMPVDKGPKYVLFGQFDEFATSQTLRSTVLRAARLELQRRRMGLFVMPSEEAKNVAGYGVREAEKWRISRVSSSLHDKATSHRLRYSLSRYDTMYVQEQITTARSRAAALRTELAKLGSEAKEDLLLRHFIADTFLAPHERAIAARFFLPGGGGGGWQESASLVLLPLSLAVMVLVPCAIRVGARASGVWLTLTLLALLIDLAALQPLRILFKSVMHTSIAAQARETVEGLSKNAKLYMRRTQGMLSGAGSLVQHFNPACRVAQMYPRLPISRLLLSLNDQDVSLRVPTSFVGRAHAFTASVLFSFALLPGPAQVQDCALELGTGSTLWLLLLGLYHVYPISPYACWGVLVGVPGLLLAWWACTTLQARRRHRTSMRYAAHSKVGAVADDFGEDYDGASVGASVGVSVKGGASVGGSIGWGASVKGRGGSVGAGEGEGGMQDAMVHIDQGRAKPFSQARLGTLRTSLAQQAERRSDHKSLVTALVRRGRGDGGDVDGAGGGGGGGGYVEEDGVQPCEDERQAHSVWALLHPHWRPSRGESKRGDSARTTYLWDDMTGVSLASHGMTVASGAFHSTGSVLSRQSQSQSQSHRSRPQSCPQGQSFPPQYAFTPPGGSIFSGGGINARGGTGIGAGGWRGGGVQYFNEHCRPSTADMPALPRGSRAASADRAGARAAFPQSPTQIQTQAQTQTQTQTQRHNNLEEQEQREFEQGGFEQGKQEGREGGGELGGEEEQGEGEGGGLGLGGLGMYASTSTLGEESGWGLGAESALTDDGDAGDTEAERTDEERTTVESKSPYVARAASAGAGKRAAAGAGASAEVGVSAGVVVRPATGDSAAAAAMVATASAAAFRPSTGSAVFPSLGSSIRTPSSAPIAGMPPSYSPGFPGSRVGSQGPFPGSTGWTYEQAPMGASHARGGLGGIRGMGGGGVGGASLTWVGPSRSRAAHHSEQSGPGGRALSSPGTRGPIGPGVGAGLDPQFVRAQMQVMQERRAQQKQRQSYQQGQMQGMQEQMQGQMQGQMQEQMQGQMQGRGQISQPSSSPMQGIQVIRGMQRQGSPMGGLSPQQIQMQYQQQQYQQQMQQRQYQQQLQVQQELQQYQQQQFQQQQFQLQQFQQQQMQQQYQQQQYQQQQYQQQSRAGSSRGTSRNNGSPSRSPSPHRT